MNSRLLYALRGGIACGLFIVVAGIAPGTPVAAAAAQSSPTLNPKIITKQDPLTANDESQVAAYVEHWSRELQPSETTTDAVTRIQRAMRQLGTIPFALPNVSPTFRVSFSSMLVPQLERMIDSSNGQVAVRALYLAARVGTDAGLDLIIEELNSSDGHRRNAAAGRAKLAMSDVGTANSMISQSTIATLLRTASKQIKDENHGPALQRELELLDAIHLAARRLAGQFPSLAPQVQGHRLTALSNCATRLRDDIVQIDGIDLFLRNLRSHFLANPTSAAADGPKLATSITTMLEGANTLWDDVHQHRASRDSYGRLINDCEGFLKLIDQTIGRNSRATTPSTRLKEYWLDGDKALFERDLQKWQQRMQMAPYNQGG